MKVLVAGSTGLVGSAVIRAFEGSPHEVTGISSRDVDLRSQGATREVLLDRAPDVVIDAAAKVGGIGAISIFPVEFLSDNIRIQTNLMMAAHEAKVKRFIFLGSSCIYPRDSIQPIKESALMQGKLEQSNSAYAIAKISGIELIRAYRREYGHHWISLMPSNLYGPNDNFHSENSHVLPALIKKFIDARDNNLESVTLWGTGKPRREFLHVDDLARAILVALEEYDDDNHLNVGSGQEISISDLATMIATTTNFKGSVKWDKSRLDGTPRKILDTTRALELGWHPRISLANGIATTVEWFEKNRPISRGNA
jgi:GDP-L-fucose synthase